MTFFNECYYVLKPSNIRGTPILDASSDTASRNYDTGDIRLQTKPFVFTNGRKESFQNESIKSLIPPILFDSPNIVVINGIKEALEIFGTEKVSFFPAIYIDDEDQWHEDYWFVYQHNYLDCWDRNLSSYDEVVDEDENPIVDRYVLSDEVLNNVPEIERLFFIMDQTAFPEFFVHQKIIDYFEEAQVTGWRAFRVSEYEFGMEFR